MCILTSVCFVLFSTENMQSNNNEKEGFPLFHLIVERGNEEENAILAREKAEIRAAFNAMKREVKGEINILAHELRAIVQFYQNKETASMEMVRTCIMMINKLDGDINALRQAIEGGQINENDDNANEEDEFAAILRDLNVSDSSAENEV